MTGFPIDPRRMSWRAFAAAIWGLVAAWLYFSHCAVGWKYVPDAFNLSNFQPVDLPERCRRWGSLARGPLVAAWATWVLLHWGGRLRALIGAEIRPRSLRLAMNFALGSLVLNLFWVGTGFLGLWRAPVAAAAAIAFSAPALAGAFRRFREGGRKDPLFHWTGHSLPGNLLISAGFLYLLIALLQSLTPDLFFDSNVYHLALPNLWIRLGGIRDVPGNFFSQYPFGGEFLMLNGFRFASDEAAKGLHVAALFFAGLAAYGWVNEEAGPRAGAFAAGSLWTFPLLNMNVWNAQVEGVITLFLVLFLYALSRSMGRGDDARVGVGGSPSAFWMAACLLASGAMAVKYVSVIVLGAVWVGWLWHRSRGRVGAVRMAEIQVALAALVIVVGPWWVKNLCFAGNPWAPYFADWFGGNVLPAAGRVRLLMEQHHFIEQGRWAFLTWPVTRMIHLEDIADFTGPFPLMFLPAVLFLRPPSGTWRWFRDAWVLALVGGGMVTHVMRFHAPVMGLGFVMAAVFLGRTRKEPLADDGPRTIGGRFFPSEVFGDSLAIWSLVAFALAAEVLPALSNITTVYYSPAGMISARETRSDFLARAGDTPYGALAEEAAAYTAPGDRILVVGDSRSLHYPRIAFAQTVFDEQALVRWIWEDPGADAVRRGLRRWGIDAVVISGREAARRGIDYRLFNLSPQDWRRLSASFEEALAPVALDRWGGLYRVRPAEGGSSVVRSGLPQPLQLLSPPGAGFVRAYEESRWADAEKMLDSLVGMFPGEGYWYEQRAHIRAKRGEREAACGDLATAERLGFVHPESLELAGSLNCGKGK